MRPKMKEGSGGNGHWSMDNKDEVNEMEAAFDIEIVVINFTRRISSFAFLRLKSSFSPHSICIGSLMQHSFHLSSVREKNDNEEDDRIFMGSRKRGHSNSIFLSFSLLLHYIHYTWWCWWWRRNSGSGIWQYISKLEILTGRGGRDKCRQKSGRNNKGSKRRMESRRENSLFHHHLLLQLLFLCLENSFSLGIKCMVVNWDPIIVIMVMEVVKKKDRTERYRFKLLSKWSKMEGEKKEQPSFGEAVIHSLLKCRRDFLSRKIISEKKCTRSEKGTEI